MTQGTRLRLLLLLGLMKTLLLITKGLLDSHITRNVVGSHATLKPCEYCSLNGNLHFWISLYFHSASYPTSMSTAELLLTFIYSIQCGNRGI